MASSTLDYLDAYCERAGDASMLAEPLNAVTNIAFLIAAFLCLRQLLGLGTPQFRAQCDLWLLVVAMAAIAVGSGLWHIYATRQTMLADVIPITIFMNVYLIAALRRLFAMTWLNVVVLWLVYQGATVASQVLLPPDFMHGTVMYLPTYGTLLLLTMGLFRRDKAQGRIFEVAVIVWSFSLFFRTVDLEFCQFIPIGTHFLWHVLNSYVLYRLFGALIIQVKKS